MGKNIDETQKEVINAILNTILKKVKRYNGQLEDKLVDLITRLGINVQEHEKNNNDFQVGANGTMNVLSLAVLNLTCSFYMSGILEVP